MVPHEIAIGGVYMPPVLIAGILGMVAAAIAGRLLNRYRLSRYFFYPPLVFVALTLLFTVLIGTFIVPG
jgi:predicted MFS family arabinose efflux permease